MIRAVGFRVDGLSTVAARVRGIEGRNPATDRIGRETTALDVGSRTDSEGISGEALHGPTEEGNGGDGSKDVPSGNFRDDGLTTRSDRL
jgi:hypothetical protein